MKRARARYSVRLPVTPAAATGQVRRRAAQTEDSLTRWRTVAAGRRRAWELAQWLADEKARRRRRRWLQGIRGAVSTMLVFALSVGVVAIQSGPDAEARAVAPAMSQDAATDLASGMLASDVDEALAVEHRGGEEPAVQLAAHQPALSTLLETEPTLRMRLAVGEQTTIAPGVERFVGPNPQLASVVGVDHASIAQWSDDDHRWVRFQVETDEPTWIRWRDASGKQAMEDMPCAFPTEDAHQCVAGRSHWRIATALKDGARAGRWTIEACTGDVCQLVDYVEV